MGKHDVLVVGSASAALVQHVTNLCTEQIVMTGERYRHVIERHAELNDRDPNILVLYRTDFAGITLRIALWISEEDGRSNSIHSAQFAHAKEQERGARRGKIIWRRG